MRDFIQVERDDSNFVRALQKLQAAVGDISPALLDIGEVLLESTKKRFETGTAPEERHQHPASGGTDSDHETSHAGIIRIGFEGLSQRCGDRKAPLFHPERIKA